MWTDNGILALVPGEYIAVGLQQLPSAGELENGKPARDVTIEVPDLGAVRISYALNTYRHGRTRLWHWTAVRADLVLP